MTDPNSNQTFVTVITPNDVLFGRGSGPNDHEGNIRFRDSVSLRKGEYMATNHRQTKAKIAKTIVDSVFLGGGRFLKKMEAAELQRMGFSNGNMDVYTIVDDDTVMEKAKQALRQNREKMATGSDVTTTGGGTGTVEQDAAAATLSMTTANAATAAPPQAILSSSSSPNHNHNHNHTSKPPSTPSYPPSSSTYEIPEPLPVRNNMEPLSYNHLASSEVEDAQQQQQHQQHHHHQQQQGINHLYSDDEGYTTYTTSLDDPDDEKLFDRRGSAQMGGQMMEISSSAGAAAATGAPGTSSRRDSGSRRGSLLGGRKDASSRRDSLPMSEIWRRDSMVGMRAESMQMSELMESFKGMSTTGDLNSSTDTIGTIDNINMYASGGGGGGSLPNNLQMSGISNMSVVSMSSTPSLFKTASNGDQDSTDGVGDIIGDNGPSHERTNSSDMIDEIWGNNNNNNNNTSNNNDPSNTTTSSTGVPPHPTMMQQHMHPPATANALRGGGGMGMGMGMGGGHNNNNNMSTRESLNPAEMWNSRQIQALLRAEVDPGSSTNLTLGGLGGESNVGPRLLGQMQDNPDHLSSYMGSSSLSVLRSMNDQSSSSSFRVPAGFGPIGGGGGGPSPTNNHNQHNNHNNTQSVFDSNQNSARILPPERR
jgi:hypothetical protein